MFKKLSIQKLLLLLGDIILIICSINLAYIIRVKKLVISYLGLNKGILTTLLILSIYLLSFYIFNLYNLSEKFLYTRFLVNMVGAVISVALILIGLFYAFPFVVGRGVSLISLVLAGILVHIWRVSFFILFVKAFPKKKVLILGTGETAETVHSHLKARSEYNILGFVGYAPRKKHISKNKILGDFTSLGKIINNQKIDDIIITTEIGQNKKLKNTLVSCKMKGISIWDIPTFYEYFFHKIPIQHIKETWFLSPGGFEKLSSNIYIKIKRAFDLLVSLIVLIIVSPFAVLIALAIKLDSKGPIFLTQERIGKSQKPFNLLKFRTMVSDAEMGKPMWTKENDIRVTRAGKIIRKMRLDELPQLINIIKGEMSLIGPRPERKFFVKILMNKIPFYSLRFSVKPGLTGWAQIIYKYGDSVDDAAEKLQYELYYIKNMSLSLDLRILLKTIRIVLFGMGR